MQEFRPKEMKIKVDDKDSEIEFYIALCIIRTPLARAAMTTTP